jgi:DNA-binding NarL/FixJ family response regulator
MRDTASTLTPAVLERGIDHTPDGLADVRVIAVDTRSERRHLMRLLLERSFQPAEIAEAESQAAAVDLVERLHPELVVVEIQMPLEEGLDTISALKRLSPAPRVVVCSFLRDPATVRRALDRGADAYLTKPVSPGLLAEKIRLDPIA